MMTLQKYKNSSTSPPLLENLYILQILRVALGRELLITIWRLLQSQQSHNLARKIVLTLQKG